jgi:hypothetical protein
MSGEASPRLPVEARCRAQATDADPCSSGDVHTLATRSNALASSLRPRFLTARPPVVSKTATPERRIMKSTSNKIAFVLLLSVLVASGGILAQQSDRSQRLTVMKSKGPDASLSITRGGKTTRVTSWACSSNNRASRILNLPAHPLGARDSVVLKATLATSVGPIRQGPSGHDRLRFVHRVQRHSRMGSNSYAPTNAAPLSGSTSKARGTRPFKSLEAREPMTLSELLVERLGPQFE